MSRVIVAGQLCTLAAWLVMGYNLAMPFAAPISLALNILLGITVVMHAVQVVYFHLSYRRLTQPTPLDYLMIGVFGIFSLLRYRQQHA